METGIFFFDFAQQLHRKNVYVPGIYFTLFDAARIFPTPIVNQKSKAKKRESWVPSKSERQKLQKLYTQGAPDNGSVRNLVKASNPSASKVRQFLHSKPSYTNFNLATREFKQIKAFTRFKNEIWSMDFAHVDKLVKKITV